MLLKLISTTYYINVGECFAPKTKESAKKHHRDDSGLPPKGEKNYRSNQKRQIKPERQLDWLVVKTAQGCHTSKHEPREKGKNCAYQCESPPKPGGQGSTKYKDPEQQVQGNVHKKLTFPQPFQKPSCHVNVPLTKVTIMGIVSKKYF